MANIRLRRFFEPPLNGSWGSEPRAEAVDLPCIRGADFDYEALKVNLSKAPIRSYSTEEVLARSVRRGDLVIEKSGGGDGQPVGRAVLYTHASPAMPTNFAARLRVAHGVDSRFATYLLAMLYAEGLTRAAIKQTTGIQNLDLRRLLSADVSCPRLGHQRAIADYLDRETARLDSLMVRMDRSARLAKQSLLARVEETAGRSTSELAPLRRFVAGITTGSRDWSELVLEGDSYFIRATNLRRDSTLADVGVEKLARLQAPSNAEARRAMLQPGDVLMCVTGYPGSVAYWTGEIGPAFVSQHVAAIRPAPGIVGQWLAYALLAPSVQAEIAARQYGGTKQGLGLVDLKELRVPLICPAEQAAVASELAKAERTVESVVRHRERQIGLLKEKRQALIAAAVTGQLPIPGAA